ncbi:MAG: chemotaxis protein CheW [Thermodesulfobacteriota bacterium]
MSKDNSVEHERRIEGGKFLTFHLHGEEYGLEILKVREIMGVMEITAVPQAPGHVKGVINLRGKVIPVIDLRLKFGFEEVEYNDETCIIVIDVRGVLMGIIVDTVSEVLDIEDEDVDATPSFGEGVNTEFILGMGKVNDKIKILLDIDKILAGDDLEYLGEIAGDASEGEEGQSAADLLRDGKNGEPNKGRKTKKGEVQVSNSPS